MLTLSTLYAEPAWLSRLAWLCARAAAMHRYEADMAIVEAAVRRAEREVA